VFPRGMRLISLPRGFFYLYPFVTNTRIKY